MRESGFFSSVIKGRGGVTTALGHRAVPAVAVGVALLLGSLIAAAPAGAAANRAVRALAKPAVARALLGAPATRGEGDPGWSIDPTPSDLAPTGTYSGDSCAGPSFCVAVGNYEDPSNDVSGPLAELWNGTAWAVQSVPTPSGGYDVFLQGVSCSSSTACTAVGYYTTSLGAQDTLAEAWNGTAWSAETTPNPADTAGSVLEGVSCSSSTACTAFGYYEDTASDDDYLTLAEAWNGTAWSIQASPNPSGATDTLVYGVSCSSPAVCTAVGWYTTNGSAGGPPSTLAEAWNGAAWSIETTTPPTGATASALWGVSCSSATACSAVGGYTNSAGTQVSLAEVWSGAAWSIQTAPNHSGATFSTLYGVSCSSATACTAVGYYVHGKNGPAIPLAEARNGTVWKLQTIHNPKGGTGLNLGDLDGVSCISSSACTAVWGFSDGDDTRVTLAEAWNGTAWRVQSTPNPAGPTNTSLYGVSCSSATACIGVGGYTNTSDIVVTLAEAWNGTAWSVQSTPDIAGATYSILYGVSCSSAAACTAVGAYEESGIYLTLAEAWNGTAWSIEPTPTTGGPDNFLDGVSCASATACTAVGGYDNSGVFLTLAEAWNGTDWTIQFTPVTGGQDNYLEGVSCSAATACTAVGTYDVNAHTEATLAEAWNGTAWAIQATPATGGQDNYLEGVSCSAATACTAVGSFETSGTPVTLAERWNGTAWAVQSTVNPTGSTSFLNGVSCSSATSCTAVGNSDTASVYGTLAEVWNGSVWAVQSTPNADPFSDNQYSSTLEGVSCDSATTCTAVGYYRDDIFGTDFTLAETES